MADAQLELPWQLDAGSVRALAVGINGNPFAALGPHDRPEGRVIRAFLPGASKVEVLRRSDGAVLAPLQPTHESGLFENLVGEATPYLFRIYWPQAIQETEDPYSFGLLLGDIDLFLFNEGRHFELAKCFGAQSLTVDGINGVRFAVWAPNAARVAVVGDFNSWDPPAASHVRAPRSRNLGTVPATRRTGLALQIRYCRPGRQPRADEGRPSRPPDRNAAKYGIRCCPAGQPQLA